MTKTNFATWLDTLRSGRYEQARGALKKTGDEYDDDSYCCLGVACEISGKGVWEETARRRPEYMVVEDDRIKSLNDALLPTEVRDWLMPDLAGNSHNIGVRPTCPLHPAVQPNLYGSPSGSCEVPGCHTRLLDNIADLNDFGASFEQIADVLEINYPELL